MIWIKREKSIHNILIVLNQIPEFEGTFSEEYLADRISPDSILLVAFKNNIPVGCKIAFNRYKDGSVYSWLGGVLPEARQKGVAQILQNEMEQIAKTKGYHSIVFKTRNKFKAMLQFALKNNFQIIGFEKKESISENRIILKKNLK